MPQDSQFFTSEAHALPTPKIKRAAPSAVPIAAPTPAPDLSQVVREVREVHGAEGTPPPVDGTLDGMLSWVVRQDASDLHLKVGMEPKARMNGRIQPIGGIAPLTQEQMEGFLFPLLTPTQRKVFDETGDLDFSHVLGENTARFRGNLHRARQTLGAVFRLIPTKVRTASDLELPDAIVRLAQLKRGLVLTCGPTGSGKSTLQAALINEANLTRSDTIVTIEDPIEFVHQDNRCLIRQREVGVDTDSFATGLRAVLRQDPDIILVGEIRDYETAHIALEAAESGHLVFATLHTKSASETVSRFRDMFPGPLQNQVQSTMRSALQAVIVQVLVGSEDGRSRHAAREVMFSNPAVRAKIGDGKLEQITSILQSQRASGMHTLDYDLARLVKEKKITLSAAEEYASDIDEVRNYVGGAK